MSLERPGTRSSEGQQQVLPHSSEAECDTRLRRTPHMRYAYYPGCSLESTSVAYDMSTRAVASLLGIDLAEIDDWNCCGATEYWAQDELTACAVIARNLALVEPDLDQVVAPCAACFLNLKKVDRLMMEHPDISTKVNEALATRGLSDLCRRPDRTTDTR